MLAWKTAEGGLLQGPMKNKRLRLSFPLLPPSQPTPHLFFPKSWTFRYYNEETRETGYHKGESKPDTLTPDIGLRGLKLRRVQCVCHTRDFGDGGGGLTP